MFRMILSNSILFAVVALLFGCATTKTRNTAEAAGITVSSIGANLDASMFQETNGMVPLGTSESINTEHLVEQTMDNSDQIRMMEAIDINPTYKASNWMNPNTGARFTVVPTTNLITIKGNKNCRRYRVIVVVNGQKGHLHDIACKLENGGWQALAHA